MAWGPGCAEVPEAHSSGQAPAADFRMATYNVHYLDLEAGADDEWGVPAWRVRRDPVVAQVRRMRADIIAFQELETRGQEGAEDLWERWLLGALPEYRVAASEFGAGASVGQPIFYRPGAFRLLDDGYAFFTRPHAKFRSIRAIAGYPDAVTWARLEHRESGERVTVFNVHLHYLDTTQRLRSARRVLDLAEAARARGDNVLVAGDFNARRNSRALRIFYEGGFARAAQRGATFHFNTGLHLFGAIDHLLHDGRAVPVGRTVTGTGRIGGVYPADHYPVWADFRLLAGG